MFWFFGLEALGILSYAVKFSHSVVSDSLQPRESQHSRPPCPSPAPRVHPNSCPLSWWCHPTILSSVPRILQARTLEWVAISCEVSPKVNKNKFTLVQFIRSVVSNSLQPHELQHARPPCPSTTPRVHQTHIHRVGDAIQPSHPLSSPSPPAPNPSQHQSLFQWVNSSYEVAEVLEFQL